MTPAAAPCGTWPSPVGARLVAAHDGRPEYVDTVGQEVWWTEPRPAEDGRRALLRLRAGDAGTAGKTEPEFVLPPPWDVRSRVIEYGGRPWAGAERPAAGPLVVFVHHADQRMYALEPDVPGARPYPLTPLPPAGEGPRWADPVVLVARGEVWCVLEESTGPAPTDVRRVLAAVPLDGSAAADRSRVRELTDGTDRFVTGPRLSPDGRHAAWLAWDHPRMPWDGTVVRLAEVTAEGTLAEVRAVAGGEAESVAQADWAADGTLLFSGDASGWWNLYRLNDPATALCPREEEFGGPLWKLGHRWFAPLADGTVAVLHGRGPLRLGVLDPVTGRLADVPGPWTEWAPALAAAGTRVTGVAAGPRGGYEVVELDTATGHTRVVGAAPPGPVDPAYLPEPVERVVRGPGGREVHALLYSPRNPRYTVPEGELPPYVVRAHGGPTGRAAAVPDLETAYFTSRGIGVVEVNYGGSAGYGRAYRERLRGSWGVTDVEDCAAVARALAAEGTADPARLAVRGGSAGGWTAACSLVSPAAEDLYACGVIAYPVLDPEDWAGGGTHDFESRYLEGLLGSPAEHPERYRERSPLRGADRITVPFLLLQGLDDPVCPPAQCDHLLAAVAGRGVPHAYLAFEGEGHGFRRAETVARAVEAELALYARVFGFERGDVPALELTE
ncbi:acyl-peptide hydrolase [Streptomyces carminius]|uniref:Acyl-peptide hydrolase n=1 Tax=Streptomyces carminius TaxID=2665496 RepID=A0A2M8LP34_9ACTN|nr:prolyl oligopeptidase family serine peptidase [Streptomyces carminius]PJE93723.1 acyl-peptide hydrolase [Streptomyces carminius]